MVKKIVDDERPGPQTCFEYPVTEKGQKQKISLLNKLIELKRVELERTRSEIQKLMNDLKEAS
ncbi:conserved domain protein [delta proteobacterium NaphS2]|nr:conserved domain protein [delta proteobacterium NaphS2]